MRADGGGWWGAAVTAPAGTDYAFLLGDDETPLPDPRSALAAARRPRRIADVRPRRVRVDRRRLAGPRRSRDRCIYELHIGTFTPGGTFDAAIERLDHLVDLGIDLVEVLPVNAFDGPHGWGYDGVAAGARCTSRTADRTAFKRFVDACHARGLGVLLDVVYNHLGPVRRLPGPVRPVLRRPERLGAGAQPRRAGLRRGPPLRDRQRDDVVRALPRRRAAARRRPRARRPACPADPGGAVGRDRTRCRPRWAVH